MPTRDPHLKANITNRILAKNMLFRVLFKLFSMKRVLSFTQVKRHLV